jgi:hypothetical protein
MIVASKADITASNDLRVLLNHSRRVIKRNIQPHFHTIYRLAVSANP